MSGLALTGGGWTITGTAAAATSLAGGSANQIPYQTGPGATSFIAAPSVSNTVLSWNGSAFVWVAGSEASDITVGTTTVTGGTSGRLLYSNAGVLGQMTNTGTGTVAVLQTSPALITPALGVATSTSLAVNGATIGGNALAVTGTSLLSGNVTTSGTALSFTGGGATIGNNASSAGNLSLQGHDAVTLQAASSAVALRWEQISGSSGLLDIGSTSVVGWASTAAPAGVVDTDLSRIAAGVVGVGTGAQGSTAGILRASAVLGVTLTVATLPTASSNQGAIAFVSDATLTAITGLGLAVTGGGANKVPVYSDGTNWIIL